MYPPQTSLIPITVALVKYIEANGFSQIYPYWYLGVPTKFLIGPIVPIIFINLHQFFPNLSYFSISYMVLIPSFLIGALGWGLLAGKLSDNKRVGLITGVLFLILPWKWLSALALSETSMVMAKNILPWALLSLNYSLSKRQISSAVNRLTIREIIRWVVSIITFSFIFLINTSIIPLLAVGMVALICSRAFREQKSDQSFLFGLSFYGTKSFAILLSALILVTIWYGPAFWWTLIINPSLGTNPGLEITYKLLDLPKTIIPLTLASLVVIFSNRVQARFGIFSSVWMVGFLSLTIFNFFIDWNSWQDWTGWLFELEIGLALFLGLELSHGVIPGSKRFQLLFPALAIPLIITFYVYSRLGFPALVSSSLPKGIASLEEVNNIVHGSAQRVFLSGTTAFWANSLYDIYQVRGGRDEVSTHAWQDAAYTIKAGPDVEKTRARLGQLVVSYVLVHGEASKEYYHDFKNLEKWDQLGVKIWEKDGDMIYQIEQAKPKTGKFLP